MKKLLKSYNASVKFLQENNNRDYQLLSSDNATDVGGSLYVTSYPKSPQNDNGPDSFKRLAVDTLNLILRAGEEVHLLEQEMGIVLTSIHASCELQEVRLGLLKEREDFSESALLQGVFCIQKQLLDKERHLLSSAARHFSSYIPVPQPISTYVERHVTFLGTEDDMTMVEASSEIDDGDFIIIASDGTDFDDVDKEVDDSGDSGYISLM